MNAIVIYESMYGNTAKIAEAIGRGLQTSGVPATVVPIDRVGEAAVVAAGLVVLGGPTHVHGMSRDATRAQAANDEKNTFEHPTSTPGIRAWLDDVAPGGGRDAAAFDTRFDGPMVFTGSAARGIAKQLGHKGYRVNASESFLVTKENLLVEGEASRAEAWGVKLAQTVSAAADR